MENNIEEIQIKKQNNTIREIAESIKFYLPLILILPPILGGLWQLLELMLISPSYIRFFSTSQLLADGFLVLLFLAVLMPFSFLCPVYLPKLENKKRTDIDCMAQFFIVFTITASIIAWFFVKFESLPKKLDLFTFILFIFFIFLCISIFFFFLLKFIHKHRNNFVLKNLHDVINDNHIKERIEKSKEFFGFFGFSVIVYALIFLFLIFHNSNILPERLKNIEYIQDKSFAEKYKSSKLLYINDKYIFIEHTDTNSTIVEIVKFDKLFEN